MKKVLLYCSAVAAIAAMQSCKNASFDKTKSGLMYKIISDNKSPLVKKGEFIKVHYVQKIKDSVMFSSFNTLPTYAQVDSVGPIYSPMEVFPFVRKGDSLVVVQISDSVVAKMGGQMPPYMKKGDQLVLSLRVIDVLKDEEAVKADRENEMQAFQERENKAVEKYLADNKINAAPAGNGVFVEILSEGNGAVADSGKIVSVMYTGTLMDGGKEFDSNRDTARNPAQTPLSFTMGQHQMIPGFEQGLKGLKSGTKAKIYIPSAQGYGQQPMPGGKGFDNLIFDVEIVEIKADTSRK